MPATDMSMLLVFGLLLLAAYIGGGVIALALSFESRRDRAELRMERRGLLDENRHCSAELLKLKEDMILLRAQLVAAVLEINKYTAALDDRENLNS